MVKRFHGKSPEEALALAKWELGDEAVILSAGKTREPWWKFWDASFQVLVATDAAPRPTQHSTVSPPTPVPRSALAVTDSDRIERLLTSVEARLAAMPNSGSGSHTAYRWLRDAGMEKAPALALVADLDPGEEAWRPQLADAVSKHLPTVEPIRLKERQAVMFVGPTGSGKTTTVAKLAAYFALERKVSVLLITTDTFRTGAIDQLEAFAEILQIPLLVARKSKDIGAMIRASDAHVILIDTPGHSVQHPLHMAEIRAITEIAEITAVILTIAAVMAPADIRAVKSGFLGDRPGRICITKADETQAPGGIIGAVLDLGCPLSYVTDGQGVPEDIQVALPQKLAAWLMTGHFDG